MLYIARKLVASPKGILLDELAEELYLSRGALRLPLRSAIQFCESFRIQVVSIPGQGFQVTGEEHLLRLAATELFELYFHTMELDQVDEAYAQWVKCDYQERQDIRHVFLAVLRESPFPLLDMASQRIARYLIIARNRCRAGLPLHLPAPWLWELQTTPIYQVADDIYHALAQRFDGYHMDDHETGFLAILLLTSLSPSLQPFDPAPAPHLTATVSGLTDTLMVGVLQSTGTDLAVLPGARTLLETTILPMVAQTRYGMDGYQSISEQNANSYLRLPLEAFYAKLIAAELSRSLQYKVSERDLAILACSVHMLLWQVEYPVKPLRLLMCNSDLGGSAFSQLIARRLKSRWPQLIESIDSMPLYEVRRLDPGSYDAVLLGRSQVRGLSTYYNYNAPSVFVLLDQPHQYFEHVYNNILIHAFRFDAVLPKAESLRLYEDFRYYDTEQAFQLLCARYAKDSASEMRLLSLLRQRERMFTMAHRDCAIIPAEQSLCREACFHFYHLSKPGMWGDQRIEWLVFLTVSGRDPAFLKALGIILENLAKTAENFPDYSSAPLPAFRQFLQENVKVAQK